MVAIGCRSTDGRLGGLALEELTFSDAPVGPDGGAEAPGPLMRVLIVDAANVVGSRPDG